MAETGLTGEQFEELRAAILSAFLDPNDLRPPVRFAFNVGIYTIVTQAFTLPQQVVQLIEFADTRGKVKELVAALRRPLPTGNPDNPKLKAFDESLRGKESFEKMFATLCGEENLEASLEKLVGSIPSGPVEPDAWRAAMIRAESVVCRIESPERVPVGTGFLIGPDLVLTNQHVREKALMDKNPGAVRFRFGYRSRSDQSPDDGTLHSLAPNWLVHSSAWEKFDYAIVQLAAKAGAEPIGTFVGAPARGWLSAGATSAAGNQPLFILQHPRGGPLKMAPGVLQVAAGDWLEYAVDTEKGSSGSPVLNCLWELLALHSRAGKGEVNRGISMSAILNDLPPEVKARLKPAPKP